MCFQQQKKRVADMFLGSLDSNKVIAETNIEILIYTVLYDIFSYLGSKKSRSPCKRSWCSFKSFLIGHWKANHSSDFSLLGQPAGQPEKQTWLWRSQHDLISFFYISVCYMVFYDSLSKKNIPSLFVFSKSHHHKSNCHYYQ